jgi:hypothetical protein
MISALVRRFLSSPMLGAGVDVMIRRTYHERVCAVGTGIGDIFDNITHDSFP